jgi:hypothetical protein
MPVNQNRKSTVLLSSSMRTTLDHSNIKWSVICQNGQFSTFMTHLTTPI